MIDDAAAHRAVITVEDGLRAGGAGEAMRDAIAALHTASAVTVMGIPTMFIAQGKPEAILAGLGLDAVGIAAAAREMLAR
jgi:1-deoxy-D-xylulose-5-phosphate synthase